MKRLERFWAFVAFTALIFTGCGVDLAPELEVEGLIRVGVAAQPPAFIVENDAGELGGVYSDMVRDLGLYLNRETGLVLFREEGLPDAVRSGEVDVAFLLRPSGEGEASGLAFSKPFAWLGLGFLTGPESDLDGVEDLNAEGIAVVVLRESRADPFVRTALPQALVRVVDDVYAAVDALLAEEVQAFVHDALGLFDLVEAKGGRLRAVLPPFRRVGVLSAVREDNEALLEALNDFLHDYRAIGGFDRLADRYFPGALEAFDVQGAAFLFDPPERVMIDDSEPAPFLPE